jgi:hypothetical protein
MYLHYILLVHKNPNQLKRLVDRLDNAKVKFYIHIDANTDINPYKSKFLDYSNIHFITTRYPGIWGDIGIVKATLEGLRIIAKTQEKGYTILLSGQDYPLKSFNSIQEFFHKENSCFIDVSKVSEIGWKLKGKDRLEFYKINLSERRGHFVLLPSIFDKCFYQKKTLYIIKGIIKAGKWREVIHIFKKRKPHNHIIPYGGSQWWAAPNFVIEKMITFIDDNPSFVKFHTYSLLPDEMFFQSILMKIKENNQDIVIKSPVTYIDWKRKNVPLPVTFTSKDFDELTTVAQTKLFARKFDIDVDDKILELLDSRIM